LRIELLRLAAEAGATKNGELGAQLLDHQRLGADLGPEPGDGTPTISTTPARRKLQSPKSRLEPRTKRFLLFGQVVFALVDGLPTVFTIPHSRLNGLDELALASNGYETLIRSDESGVNVFVKDQGSLLVFLQGHPEYEAGARHSASSGRRSRLARSIKAFTSASTAGA